MSVEKTVALRSRSRNADVEAGHPLVEELRSRLSWERPEGIDSASREAFGRHQSASWDPPGEQRDETRRKIMRAIETLEGALRHGITVCYGEKVLQLVSAKLNVYGLRIRRSQVRILPGVPEFPLVSPL